MRKIFLLVFVLLSALETLWAKDVVSGNIAPLATVSANSEYSRNYAAKFAVDGVIPDINSRFADINHCWCVNNETAKNHGELILQWSQPIDVA
ncbi:MAG: hypothetical protein LBJ00_04310, partial [Planctomycetaceae bacterium]|nr:hypothetical protein [Planctomycetaceae bacterium]